MSSYGMEYLFSISAKTQAKIGKYISKQRGLESKKDTKITMHA
jgi:hypothetical protein